MKATRSTTKDAAMLLRVTTDTIRRLDAIVARQSPIATTRANVARSMLLFGLEAYEAKLRRS